MANEGPCPDPAAKKASREVLGLPGVTVEEGPDGEAVLGIDLNAFFDGGGLEMMTRSGGLCPAARAFGAVWALVLGDLGACIEHFAARYGETNIHMNRAVHPLTRFYVDTALAALELGVAHGVGLEESERARHALGHIRTLPEARDEFPEDMQAWMDTVPGRVDAILEANEALLAAARERRASQGRTVEVTRS